MARVWKGGSAIKSTYCDFKIPEYPHLDVLKNQNSCSQRSHAQQTSALTNTHSPPTDTHKKQIFKKTWNEGQNISILVCLL